MGVVTIARLALRLSLILAVVGAVLGLIGGILIGTSIYLNVSVAAAGNDDAERAALRTVGPPASSERNEIGSRRNRLPTLTPTPEAAEPATPTASPTQITSTSTVTATPDDLSPTPEESDDAEEESTRTVEPSPTATATSTEEPPSASPTPEATATAPNAAGSVEQTIGYVEPYTSTDQVQPPPSAAGISAGMECPASSEALFDLIPIEGSPMADHPDFSHADLNLSLRGYTVVSETLALEFYNGATDPNAPRLHGLFEPNRRPKIKRVYQINDWIWEAGECNGSQRGCRGGPVDLFWPVTLVGLTTTPGESIHMPERGPQIYSGGFVAMVLYAEARQITLSYTRRDNVSAGYVVHLMNVCVDPNLLGLYRAQRNADGWRTTGFLPALRNDQSLGVAAGQELLVAVRDVGSFMDPRSEKDWWE